MFTGQSRLWAAREDASDLPSEVAPIQGLFSIEAGSVRQQPTVTAAGGWREGPGEGQCSDPQAEPFVRNQGKRTWKMLKYLAS